MSEYKGIVGQKVVSYTTDPDNPVQGQVWYNATTNTLKLEGQTTSGAWSTGGSLNTARFSLGGVGTQTAALAFGGRTPSPTAVTEKYDGTSWTEVGDLNQARSQLGQAGTQTSALAFGGENPGGDNQSLTEKFNGSSWSEVADLNTARSSLTGTGADNTSAIAFGGATSPKQQTELWNDTSWTEVADLNTGRASIGVAGISTAALVFGGDTCPAHVGNVEQWNGSAWTEVADLNTSRSALGGSGLYTLALGFGGYAGPPGNTNKTESDRKSTRLNSSHGYISYAVFCLKKKTQQNHHILPCQQPIQTHKELRIDNVAGKNARS